MNKIYLAFCVSFLITVVLTPILIPVLRKLKFGQTIREIGPSWHQKKNGTPTMGGIGFFIGSLIASAVYANGEYKAALGFITIALFAVIGFADDFIKVVLKRNLGLTEIQKLFLQTVVTALFLLLGYKAGIIDTALSIPFTKVSLELGGLYFVFSAILIVGFVNAVNLTDGVDGLASSVTFIVALFFVLISVRASEMELAVIPSSVAGGLLAFLFFNANPAKVFMGDTGSLFLGGLVSVMAVLCDAELVLLLAGIIYLIEAFSVMIQVAYFKKTRKRIFLMTPIHHHFEKKGWKENKIVLVFSLITLIACIIGFFA